jgi:hypothetical protein
VISVAREATGHAALIMPYVGRSGSVTIGEQFRAVETVWMAGVPRWSAPGPPGGPAMPA